MTPTGDTEWLTPTEAADILRVTVRTLRRWDKDGYLPANRTPGKRGMPRYRREDLDAAMRGDTRESA